MKGADKCADVGEGAEEVEGARSEGADEGEGLGVKVLMKMKAIMKVKILNYESEGTEEDEVLMRLK